MIKSKIIGIWQDDYNDYYVLVDTPKDERGLKQCLLINTVYNLNCWIRSSELILDASHWTKRNDKIPQEVGAIIILYIEESK